MLYNTLLQCSTTITTTTIFLLARVDASPPHSTATSFGIGDRSSIIVREMNQKQCRLNRQDGIAHYRTPTHGQSSYGHPPMGICQGEAAAGNAYQTGPPPRQPPIQSNSQAKIGSSTTGMVIRCPAGHPKGFASSGPSSNGHLPSGPPPNAFPARGVPPPGNISNVNSSFNQRPPNAGYNLPPNAMSTYSAPPRQENNFTAPQMGQIHSQAPQMHNPPPPPQGRNGYTMGRPPPNGPVPNVIS